MELKNAKKSELAIEVSDLNLSDAKQFKEFLHNAIYWHKFYLEDVYGLKRCHVLKTLIEQALPFDLIPLQYQQDGKTASFFARTCGKAIEKFISQKLFIKNPFNENKPFKIKIILGYSSVNDIKINISRNVIGVLKKRFDGTTGVLCLNNFSEDPGLEEFITFLQPKLFAFVLNLARNAFKIHAIALCNNDIANLEAMKILKEQNIMCVDLRYNLIRDLAELTHLESRDVTDVWLEGNPLCAFYDEYNYVQNVLKYFPNIQKLDGFLLRQNGFPSFRRNFMCNTLARGLTDYFLEQYFSTYDSKNLMKLESLYHQNASFSLTTSLNDEQSSQYKIQSRNLIQLNNNSNLANLYLGRRAILKVLSTMPRCEHDSYSFTVDVLTYTVNSAFIVVTGVFREVPVISKQNLFGFSRFFVIEHSNNVNCKIVNEQLHIFQAPRSQQISAFKARKILTVPKPKDSSEEAQLVSALALITNLTKDWSKLFLEECHYNLKEAITLFMQFYECDKIPPQLLKKPN